MSLDCQASAQTCSFAYAGVAEPSRRGVERNNRRCCGLNWRSGRRFRCGLLLGPHTSSLNWCRNVVWLRLEGAVWNHFSGVEETRQPRKLVGLRKSNTVLVDSLGASSFRRSLVRDWRSRPGKEKGPDDQLAGPSGFLNRD